MLHPNTELDLDWGELDDLLHDHPNPSLPPSERPTQRARRAPTDLYDEPTVSIGGGLLERYLADACRQGSLKRTDRLPVILDPEGPAELEITDSRTFDQVVEDLLRGLS